MTESTAGTHTNADVDQVDLVADADTLAAQQPPDIEKLERDVERANTRLVKALADGETATDCRRKLQQAQRARDEGRQLADQIARAREYVHARDFAQAEADEAARLNGIATAQAQRLESAAERLEAAEQEVADAISAMGEPLKQHPGLDNVSRRQLHELIGQLNVDRQRPDLTPAGSPGRLRRMASTLRNYFGNQTNGEQQAN
jgi:hypothetical protein